MTVHVGQQSNGCWFGQFTALGARAGCPSLDMKSCGVNVSCPGTEASHELMCSLCTG